MKNYTIVSKSFFLCIVLNLYFAALINAQHLKTEMSVPLQFTKKQVASESFESVGVFDVNGDNKPDIVSGSFWYEGPEFLKRHYIGAVEQHGQYWDDFSTIPMDVNADGNMDYVSGGWFSKSIWWWENPGDNSQWQKHIIDQTGNVETVRSWDVDGDGYVEIVPNNPNDPLKFYILKRDVNGKSTGSFIKVPVTLNEEQGHGLGFGDINGDGRGDFIIHNGWLEAPSDVMKGTWKLHEEFDLGDASIPILVVDVNRDNKIDLIVGQGHSYGLSWYEQAVNASGKRKWIKHPIDPYSSQFHTMEWVDLDGDGKGELVTGKRYRAHNGRDPGGNDPIGLYYFKWNGESFVKNTISYGPLGEGKGIGLYFEVVDLNKNDRKDIVVAGKDGLYIFFNEQ